MKKRAGFVNQRRKRSILALNFACLASVLTLGVAEPAHAQPAPLPPPLGPMPEPPENPLTPEKALLGKFLFWEEQLSSSDAVACATCHQPEFGGSDPRVGLAMSRSPGFDGLFGTIDDVVGSIGVHATDANCEEIDDGVFFPERQVTGRRTPSFIGIGYSPESFWDGRATSVFLNPETGLVSIAAGGALESQAVGPILSSVEMACNGRTWDDVRDKLEVVTPMALATNLPTDMADALILYPNYPALFAQAFGTAAITAERIGFAIASYERTLVPDRTAFDFHLQGIPGVLTPDQLLGLDLFLEHCAPACHTGPELADHEFHNIGVRPSIEDLGREQVTLDPADRGQFKTPPLRNAALRAPFFHNGGKQTLEDVLIFYNNGGDFDEDLDVDMVPLMLGNNDLEKIIDFVANALLDERVQNALPPFDHPTLQPFFRRGDSNQDLVVDIADAIHLLTALFGGGGTLLCADASDANDDGETNVADPITVLSRLFQGAGPLPSPSDISFGPDPTNDSLGCAP
ncbi:MAG: cytochrome c peroxidase [Planctomycetota bacterium]